MVKAKNPKTYAFIDASNIIYGTKDSGWKVDSKKLYQYLIERFSCKKIYYFAGFDAKNQKQLSFYRVLNQIGYELILRKVKFYRQEDGYTIRKSNCDVDLTFYAMREIDNFDRVIFFSGDGDFDLLLKHFVELKKEVLVFANSRRTAKEIKELKGIKFNNLEVLRPILEKKERRNKTRR